MTNDDYTLFVPGVFQQDKMVASGFHINSQTLNLLSFYQKGLLFSLQVIFISLYILVGIAICSTFKNLEENMVIAIFFLGGEPKWTILLLLYTIFMTASWLNSSLNIKSWIKLSPLTQSGDNYNLSL